jgi:hypothetical protein
MEADCKIRIEVLDANCQIVRSFLEYVTPGQYDIRSAIGVVDTQGEIDLQTVAKFCRQSNPTKNLQNAKFNIEPGLHVFEVHLQGKLSALLPPPQPQQASSSSKRGFSKIILEEKIRAHEFEQDLDGVLQKIVQKKFYIRKEFAQKHAILFNGLPNCVIGTADDQGYPIDGDFERFLNHGIELWKKFEAVLQQPRAEMFWHVNFYGPLFGSCCLGPTPSGLLKYKVSPKLSLGPTARLTYAAGILPDVCDGWMFVNSYTEAKMPATILFNTRSYNANTLPMAEYDFQCGDPNILMIDLLAEFKGSDDINLEHDREKLFGEMAVASQSFVQILNFNPFIFGVTTSGPQFRFYALLSNEKEKQYKQLSSKNYQQTVKEAKEGKSIPRKRSASMSDLFAKQKEENELKANQEPTVEPDDTFYECYYMANVHVSNFSTYMQVLMILWRMRVARLVSLRWYKTSILDKEKKAQLTSQSQNNENNANQSNPPHANSDAETELTKEFKDLNLELKQFNLTVSEKFLNSCSESFVFKAYNANAKQVVVKLFACQEDFLNEKKTYEWLEGVNFKCKPKLLNSFETNSMQGLVLELLEGQGNLTLNSEAELKNFTIALLKVVDTLHACNVIHGDIKLSNLVYDRQCNTVKLIDFAFSEILVGRDYSTRRGQTNGYLPYYFQPMVFHDDLCNVGALLCKLVYGVDPTSVGYDHLLAITMKRSQAQPLFEVSRSFITLIHNLLDSSQVYYTAAFTLLEEVLEESDEVAVPANEKAKWLS